MTKSDEGVFPLKYKDITIKKKGRGDTETLIIIQEARLGKERIEIPTGVLGWFRYYNVEDNKYTIIGSDKSDRSDHLIIAGSKLVEKIEQRFKGWSKKDIKNLVLAYAISEKMDLED